MPVYDALTMKCDFDRKIAVETAKNSTLDKGVEEKIKKKRLVILFMFPLMVYL